jgi:hypothetical protein
MADNGELIARLQDLRRTVDDAYSAALPARVNDLLELARQLPDRAIDPEQFCEFLTTAIMLIVPSSRPELAGNIAQAVMMLEGRAGPARDEALGLVEAELTAFRYAVQLWQEDCADLPAYHPVPPPVERSMASFLESLARLERGLMALEYLASQIGWLDPLCQVLHHEREAARAEFANRLWRQRLWILRKSALHLAVGGLTPSLTEVVLENGEEPFEQEAQIVAAAQKLAGRDDSAGLARAVMSACIHDKLAAVDVELARALVERAPGQWAKAHWQALHADGFRAPVHLVKQADSVWTAAPAFRVGKHEIAPGNLLDAEIGLIEGPRLLAPSGALTIFEPHEASHPAPSELALVRRSLPLAGLALELFGDEEGLWFRAQGHGKVAKGRCGESGAEAELPLLVLASPDAPQPNFFRAGPLLRPLLSEAGRNVDRAYSPRAYLVPVGEGILRGLFGWDLREASNRLNAEALKGGITTGEQLMALDLGRLHEYEWFTRIPLNNAIRERLGAQCLHDLGWSRERLSALLGFARNSGADNSAINLGAEIATLDPALLSDDLRPVDGDAFVLMPTATATSLISAGMLSRFLQVWYPSSTIDLAPTRVMKQHSGPLQERHDVSNRPLRDVLAVAQPQLEKLMRHGADPVVIMTSGLFWQSIGSFMLAWYLRLPYVYRSEMGPPIAIRTDLLPAGRRRPMVWPEPRVPPALPESSAYDQIQETENRPRQWLVMNVGLSLTRGRKNLGHQLVDWARQQPQRWQVCAEFTAFEGWRRLIGVANGRLGVALLASSESEPCRDAIRVLLQEMGVQVLTHPDWIVQDFDDFAPHARPQQVHELLMSRTIAPIQSCLKVIAERGQQPPYVAVGSGQRMTATVLYALVRLLGCPAFFAERGNEGPVLWPLQTPGEEVTQQAERVLEKIVSPATAAATPA